MPYFIAQLTVHSRGKILSRDYVITKKSLAGFDSVRALGSPLFGTAEYITLDEYERLVWAKEYVTRITAGKAFEKCFEPLPGSEATPVSLRVKYVGHEGAIEWPEPYFIRG